MSEGVTPSADSLAAQVRQLPEVQRALELSDSIRRAGVGWLHHVEVMPDAFDAALDVLVERLAAAEQEIARVGPRYSCGYETGQGQNCGKCQQCLTVHEHFLKQSVTHERERALAAERDNERLREELITVAIVAKDEGERADDAEARVTERVLDLRNGSREVVCASCGADFISRGRWSKCESCANPTCKTCGRPLGKNNTSGYCITTPDRICNPTLTCVGPITYRSIEQGTNVRYYPRTGHTPPGFFVLHRENGKARMHRFETIEAARAFRKEHVQPRKWRTDAPHKGTPRVSRGPGDEQAPA